MDTKAEPGVLMRALQTPYIAVLNLFYNILISKIGEKVRDVIVQIGCFGLVIYAALQYSEIIIRDYIDDVNYRMLIICILIIIIALFGMKEKAKPVAWSWTVVVPFYLLGLGVLVARTHHGLATGYVLFALWLLILIPAFGLVWTGKDSCRELFDKLAFALDVIGILFVIGSIVVWPYAPYFFSEGRYTGLATNPNILAMLYLCVLTASCYLIYVNRYSGLSIISLGCAIAMLYLSESRTALLACAVAVVALLISYVRRREPDSIALRKLVISVILSIVVAVVTISAAYAPVKIFSYYGVERVKEKFNSELKFTLRECEEMGIQISDADSAHVYDIAALLTVQEDDRMLQIQEQPMEIGRLASASDQGIFDRLHKGSDAISFGSQRLIAYKWVLEQITFWGVDRDAHPIEFRDYHFNGVHNTVLDFAYQCGWLTGLWCLLLKLITIIFGIRFVFGMRSYQPGTLFVMMIICLFAVESTLEIQTLPSSRDITCYYYMIIPFVAMGMSRRRIVEHRSVKEKQQEELNLETKIGA